MVPEIYRDLSNLELSQLSVLLLDTGRCPCQVERCKSLMPHFANYVVRRAV